MTTHATGSDPASETAPALPHAPAARAVRGTCPSPFGDLLLTGVRTGGGCALTSLSLPGRPAAPAVPEPDRAEEAFAQARRELDAYFAGRLTRFSLPLAPAGTPFQLRVWQALDEVPYGTTTSYGELAARLGLSRAETRAVGRALGANPLLLVRPCHRVIGADGSLRGYAGGVERKAWLLTHEGALPPALV
ncbi:methylated-DNA--[protein]-cysteine S-methyltransferase [Streptomyces collinus]|uniref:Methylated-DNA--protein-cysteine methyltransferase n=1 Tax=Streptomyces collinus (strain DSM 40733 / Tue 365) TaxID=1214242 RepID=S5V6H4_STRC3|nr:methylated-DNA--[protein]-cysteine S-methyltransferase [Streptomyces collinus]AGS73321.1 methylated-DNA--protein-cysteine methyltransferase [Streptomyces collinus Tu 365]UJA11987.1 methylated-DNA--[protein]-cysteine S-methyltransferase [Streptomyces collinus]UJA13147.1 methylated-DNA--[protein]-cysteine S-methyltransferase [Streptomyces collinus]